jgi:hypothetical protein
MLKKLTRKLVILSALVAAIAAVSSTPASSTYGGPFCLRDPSFADCPSQIVCCTGMGDCSCMQ